MWDRFTFGASSAGGSISEVADLDSPARSTLLKPYTAAVRSPQDIGNSEVAN